MVVGGIVSGLLYKWKEGREREERKEGAAVVMDDMLSNIVVI